MILLSIFSAGLLLLNKILLIFNKKALAWILGILGMIGLSVYLYLQQTCLEVHKNLLIMVISNSSGIPIMLYGFIIIVIKKSKLKEKLGKWRFVFTFTIILFSIFLCVLFFIRFLEADLVLEQFSLSLLATIGTLLLSFDRRMTSIWGWIFLIPTHYLSADIMFRLDSVVLAIGQSISIFFAVYGVITEFRKKVGAK